MDNQTTGKNYSSIVAIICLLAIIGVGYFYISPDLSSLRDLNIKVSAKDKDLTALQTKIGTLSSMQSKFASISDQIKRLGLAVPSDDAMAEILVQIENMANNSGLKLTSIQTSKEDAKGVVPVTVNVKGDYIGLSNFTNKMENNIRPINIKSINIISASKENESLLSSNINLEILKLGGTSEQE